MFKEEGWDKAGVQEFWGDIAPCNHLVQIYESEPVFMDTLENFVISGLGSGEAVVLIATSAHLSALEARLEDKGFDLPSLKADDQYIPFIAEVTLKKIVVNDWPDEALFNELVSEIQSRAGKGKRKVRAFGEMVVLLWKQGKNEATIALEQLWNKYLETNQVTLFCAYPRAGFAGAGNDIIQKICSTHTKIIDGSNHDHLHINYKDRTNGQTLTNKILDAFNRTGKR